MGLSGVRPIVVSTGRYDNISFNMKTTYLDPACTWTKYLHLLQLTTECALNPQISEPSTSFTMVVYSCLIAKDETCISSEFF